MGHVSEPGRPQPAFDAFVSGLAARQFGVVSRAQLAEWGRTKELIRRRIAQGRLHEVGHGVLRVTSNPPSWPQSLMAACLGWGPDVVVSHRAAAALLRLLDAAPGPIELTVPRKDGRRGPGVVHRHRLSPAEVVERGPFRCTSVERTLLDLAGARIPVEEMLDDALVRRLTSIPRLRTRLDGWSEARRAGAPVLRALVEARDPTVRAPESPLETRLLGLLRRSGLPEPVPQHPVRIGGRTVAIVDFAYPEARLAIEADGFRWHAGRVRFDRDRQRLNRLALAGWRVIHVTATDLRGDPGRVAGTVRAILG